VDRRGLPVLLSLLLSVAVPRPVPLGKITLVIVTERHLTNSSPRASALTAYCSAT
jgi:hypothetical protein